MQKGGNLVRQSQRFDTKFRLSKLNILELNHKVLSIDMNLNDYSLVLATMGGNICKLTKKGENTMLHPIYREKVEIVAIRITHKQHLFYITQDHALKLLRNGSKMPREILLDVKIRQNGKNLKVYDNTILVQQGDYCIYKLDVKNVDRILSQRLKLSENFGILKDFDYFHTEPKDASDLTGFPLTGISHSKYPTRSKLFHGMVVALTSKGSLQIIDGKNKVYQLHQLKKLASKNFSQSIFGLTFYSKSEILVNLDPQPRKNILDQCKFLHQREHSKIAQQLHRRLQIAKFGNFEPDEKNPPLG